MSFFIGVGDMAVNLFVFKLSVRKEKGSGLESPFCVSHFVKSIDSLITEGCASFES